MWRLLNNRLSTKDNLIRCGIQNEDSAMCSDACGKEETLLHLLLDCDFSREVGYEVVRWLSFSFVPPREAIDHELTSLFLKIYYFSPFRFTKSLPTI
jgi:hypothetical protein